MSMGSWTPIKSTTGTTTDFDTGSKFFWGLVVTAGAAASVVTVLDGSGGATKYEIKCPANETRKIILGTFDTSFSNSAYINVDANTSRATALHG